MVKLGIDLIDQYMHLFNQKRVGLITNPTGVNSQIKSTIDILHERTNLVALFSPEHGVRGDLQAGVQAEDYIDEKTGVKVYSLYGQTKKPSKQMMDEIDILVFDIQDVGARYYTFLYTMAYAMMACKEHDKPMVIFDRPNPVNADIVEGNILNPDFQSFVGYYPIPQRYGLTIGELANLFNNEFDIHADISVVQMENYERTMDYGDTGLIFIYPSPNIPSKDTCYAYLATCIFEGTNMSEGRGTTKPFELVGSPSLDIDALIKDMDSYDLKGFKLRKTFFTPTFSKHQGSLCQGVELIITDKVLFKPVYTGFVLLRLMMVHDAQFEFLKPYRKGGRHFIDLLVGDDFARNETYALDAIKEKIILESKQFKDMKRRYHLYD
jgi:uncharacterized protein YbbC (DUF1343 family)